MSGIRHYLGADEIEGTPIDWPAIGATDRAYASRSVWYSAYGRGFYDGRALAERGEWPETYPVSAKHLKYHAAATLRAIAPEIAGASLTAKTLTEEWMAGHKAGFEAAYSKFS